jgi:hypothetical protein
MWPTFISLNTVYIYTSVPDMSNILASEISEKVKCAHVIGTKNLKHRLY